MTGITPDFLSLFHLSPHSASSTVESNLDVPRSDYLILIVKQPLNDSLDSRGQFVHL